MLLKLSSLKKQISFQLKLNNVCPNIVIYNNLNTFYFWNLNSPYTNDYWVKDCYQIRVVLALHFNKGLETLISHKFFTCEVFTSKEIKNNEFVSDSSITPKCFEFFSGFFFIDPSFNWCRKLSRSKGFSFHWCISFNYFSMSMRDHFSKGFREKDNGEWKEMNKLTQIIQFKQIVIIKL